MNQEGGSGWLAGLQCFAARVTCAVLLANICCHACVTAAWAMSGKRKAGADREESQAPVLLLPKVGSAVQILWEGEWWAANVIEQRPSSRFVVEYPDARTAIDLVTSTEVLLLRNHGQVWRWPPPPSDAPQTKQQRRSKAAAAHTTAAPKGKTATAPPATTAKTKAKAAPAPAPAAAAGAVGGAADKDARGPPPPLKAMIDAGFLLAGPRVLIFKYRVRGFALCGVVALTSSAVVGKATMLWDRAHVPCVQSCLPFRRALVGDGWLSVLQDTMLEVNLLADGRLCLSDATDMVHHDPTDLTLALQVYDPCE